MKNSKRLVKVSTDVKGLRKVFAKLSCLVINNAELIFQGIVTTAVCTLFAVIILMCLGMRW